MASFVLSLFFFNFVLCPQLDTLPKDDLIKFAKKQMAAMQKMKSRYAGNCKCHYVFGFVAVWAGGVDIYVLFLFSDLEKEVESLKQQSKNSNSGSDDSSLIQVR